MKFSRNRGRDILCRYVGWADAASRLRSEFDL